jgi:aspartate dehydrogenase
LIELRTIGAGLIGCGTIGTILSRSIDEGKAGNVRLVIVYDAYQEKAERLAQMLSNKPKVAKTFSELIGDQDVHLVLEASSQSALKEYAVRVLEAGKDLMAMSVGALVDPKLLAEVRAALLKTGRRLWIPSGAIAGLDGVKAAIVANVEAITLTTRKPPIGFAGAPGVVERGIDLSKIRSPTVLYSGSAVEACRLFPANVNVAAALSLAGIGADRTIVRIIADPNIDVNVHEIEVRGDCGVMRLRVENVPSPENPKTSYLAVLSAVATLKRITAEVQVGT